MASNSKVTATHAACGVTKQLIARHKAKERTMQDGILATEAKDQAKVEQRGFTKGKGKGMNNCEHGQRRWQAPSPFHDVLLLERTKESEHNASEKKQHIHVNKEHRDKSNQ